jgi:hypothetical protein
LHRLQYKPNDNMNKTIRYQLSRLLLVMSELFDCSLITRYLLIDG